MKPYATPERKKYDEVLPSTTEKSSFKASSYIHMVKVNKMHNRTQQIQKINFRCYTDEQIFGEEELVNFLKQTHDNDHDTPDEQIKYDISRGIKKLKDEIERRESLKNGEV